jgi:hypothetical protein
MGLTSISAKNQVANIDTDNSTEAKTCRVYYDTALEYVLADVDWNFATARIALSELSETAPADWDYVYQYPNDCLKARKIYTGLRRGGVEKIPFEVNLNADRTTKAIFTDQYQAWLRFTAKVVDPNLMPPSFVFMFAEYLGYLVAPALTKKKAVADAALARYEKLKMSASVNDIEEEEEDELPESEFIRERG